MARNKNLNTPEKRARVGERIKLAATSAGITLKELAEQVGLSASLIYQYVRGITSIPQDVLERIATVCRVNTNFFDPDKDARSTLALPAEADSEDEHGTSVLEAGGRPRIQAELRHLHQILQVQTAPRKGRAAYFSTLDQMLSLARAISDRRQEAWVIWQMGRAHFDGSDLSEARRLLTQARDMFAAEGLEEYRFHVTQDLVMALVEQGEFAKAEAHLQELLECGDRDLRWRTLITLGNTRHRQHDFEGALHYFIQAAEQLERMDPEDRDRVGMPHLMFSLADIVRATGHYEEALALWSRCLQQAIQDRKTDICVESLMEMAQCCQTMGKISEAKQRLEMAVVLAGFLFEDEARLSVAHALLANVLVAMGSLDAAKENARRSLRIANKVGAARSTILSALALTETSLVAGQWEDALDYAQEALDEAKRTGRTREMAQAKEMRARAYLREFEERHNVEDDAKASVALGRAFAEAAEALDIATRAEAIRERIAAHIALARCYVYEGKEDKAIAESQAAAALTQQGGANLQRLIGKDAERIPALLRSSEIDLPRIFAARKLNIPGLEWQAHYLEGALLAKTQGPEAAFAAMRDAARCVGQILAEMTPNEAATFKARYPEIGGVFTDLSRFALTEADKSEATALLTAYSWGQPEALPALRS